MARQGKFKNKLTDFEYYHDRIGHVPELPGVYMVHVSGCQRKYIGSSLNLRRRTLEYMRPHSDLYLKTLMTGIESSRISIEVLELIESPTKEQLEEAERHWIQKRKTFFPKGFNSKCPVTKKAYIKRDAISAMRWLLENTEKQPYERRNDLKEIYRKEDRRRTA